MNILIISANNTLPFKKAFSASVMNDTGLVGYRIKFYETASLDEAEEIYKTYNIDYAFISILPNDTNKILRSDIIRQINFNSNRNTSLFLITYFYEEIPDEVKNTIAVIDVPYFIENNDYRLRTWEWHLTTLFNIGRAVTLMGINKIISAFVDDILLITAQRTGVVIYFTDFSQMALRDSIEEIISVNSQYTSNLVRINRNTIINKKYAGLRVPEQITSGKINLTISPQFAGNVQPLWKKVSGKKAFWTSSSIENSENMPYLLGERRHIQLYYIFP
jgi:hypothetical protein